MRRFVPHRFVDDQWTCLTCGETHPDPCNCPCCDSGAKLIPADEDDAYDPEPMPYDGKPRKG